MGLQVKSGRRTEANAEFWRWFIENEKSFFQVLKEQGDVENEFFNKMTAELGKLREGYWLLAGMADDETAELIITVDGVIKNVAFVEELIAAAPAIPGWCFTALKPELDIEDICIKMAGYEFSKDNMWFYANDDPEHPDEIDITVVHDALTEENQDTVSNGCFIFIDNFLGELRFCTTIDNVQFATRAEAASELIPIEKLKAFLVWREKEFVEKYQGIRYDTENDGYSSLEGRLQNDMPLLAIVNSTLLNWDRKASHPWILSVEIKYEGNEFGMPDQEMYDLMNTVEDEMMSELVDADGFLNIGRQTANGVRCIFFACRDFRWPSMVLDSIQREHEDLEIGFDIYKDKYWRSFDRYRQAY